MVVTSDTRLFELDGGGAVAGLLVESWTAHEALSDLFEYRLNVLSADAHLPLDQILGQPARLRVTLCDGSQAVRSGVVMQAGALQCDGGFARYQLVVRPWLAALQWHRRSQSFIDQSVVEMVEAVFATHAALAAWRWSDEVAAHLAAVSPRHYCNQFRESDYDFVRRLLDEEGVGWYCEEDDAAPHGHRLVLFADSRRFSEDASSAKAGGIHIRRASSQGQSDTLQTFAPWHRLTNATVTLAGWHYPGERSVMATVPTLGPVGGPTAPRLESYDPAGGVDHHNGTKVLAAEHYGRCLIEAHEAHRHRCLGSGTLRTLRPGTSIRLQGAPLGDAEPHEYTVTEVRHAGLNNLPKDMQARVLERLGVGALCFHGLAMPEALRAQAQAAGYANQFECVPAHRPWRRRLCDDTGARLNPKPTVLGPQTAVVVGPHGTRGTHGNDEIYTDRLGRICVQFHWQRRHHLSTDADAAASGSEHSIWVRVAQPCAGPGMGAQFIPRIGQEVLVEFEECDVDRPVVLAAFYNGRGEGGSPAGDTGGGGPAPAADDLLMVSTDQRPSGQGNLTGGNSPPWHGAATGEHHQQRNAGAMSGFKSQEFGGDGHNQLVFDDTDGQLRLQVGTTQHATWLNLGHLLHQADNHRGSFRGTGFELRTDAWGALRAGRGVLLSSFAASPTTPFGDNTPGMALARQQQQLAQVFSESAARHQAVSQAGQEGTVGAKASVIDPWAAPLMALRTAVSGTASACGHGAALDDARRKHTRADGGFLPATTDPLVCVAARAGLAACAGQDLQAAAGETLQVASGQDTEMAIGGQARLHCGQAIGVLAGAVQPGSGRGGTGLTVTCAEGDLEVQAQADGLQVAAQQAVDVRSVHAHIDWAAAKKITVATAGGASITIDANGIVTQCPGKITVRAGRKHLVGPASCSYALPRLPRAVMELNGTFPFSL
ncbi:hypothetical protein AAW51_1600 [Caldimonas brevitalea]|uniref:Type VI secretion system tip protein VgrG n=1 Tax=Caldimonas brevitalea TaxID=413882 RepID=A0A0G3BLR2_9BURK|nr:hypothetical protein AAW51_1600 [Caldimonas brevitalea]